MSCVETQSFILISAQLAVTYRVVMRNNSLNPASDSWAYQIMSDSGQAMITFREGASP